MIESSKDRHAENNRIKVDALIDGDLGGDLGPQAGVFHRRNGFLGVAIHVHVQHEAAEGSAQVIGQVLV